MTVSYKELSETWSICSHKPSDYDIINDHIKRLPMYSRILQTSAIHYYALNF
jgi:hypothetical protein